MYIFRDHQQKRLFCHHIRSLVTTKWHVFHLTLKSAHSRHPTTAQTIIMQLAAEMGDAKPSVRIRGWISSLLSKKPKIMISSYCSYFRYCCNWLWLFVIMLTQAHSNVTWTRMQTCWNAHKSRHARLHTRINAHPLSFIPDMHTHPCTLSPSLSVCLSTCRTYLSTFFISTVSLLLVQYILTVGLSKLTR